MKESGSPIQVSVIMPVYNSQEYLADAINSILAQDFEVFELILVDDGSTDASSGICDEFAAGDSRVVVIHKTNGGICSARNAGIDAARGEYIAFCDNDDEYLPHLLSDNYQLAKEHDIDLQRYAKIKHQVRPDGSVWDVLSPIEEMILEEDEFSRYFLNVRKEATVWTGLYKRSIIEKYHLRFHESYRYGHEDARFNIEFLSHCRRLGFSSQVYYRWNQRVTHSTSKKFHMEYLKDLLWNVQLEARLFEKVFTQVKPADKTSFLTNAYVFHSIDYISNGKGIIRLAEKRRFLSKLRAMPVFQGYFDQKISQELFARDKKTWLIALLFARRWYILLLLTGEIGPALLARGRYQKQ